LIRDNELIDALGSPLPDGFVVSASRKTQFTAGCPVVQGCSLGLEHLGLETVSRRFLERLGLEG